ncbi:MAG TPA: outer membrane beta-barrel domain-containing protein [Polyangia bacterium]|nr:outer membrane beta-barrel domain-containing protein [Polyangia bacterium]
MWAAALVAAASPAAIGAEDAPMSTEPEPAAEANVSTPPPAAEPTTPAGTGADACIDENVKADLFAKRRQRTTRERLFQQTNRHELTVQGGYYVSDLFDGTYTFGGAYTYHMTEDLGVEASGMYTRLTSSGGPELERTFAVLKDKPRRELLFDADLVWVPAHAKMRLGGGITHFDLYVAAGAGVVDSVLSQNVAGNAGFGLKFFGQRAWAVRLDVRDHVYRQQLLSQVMWVNDLTATVGISLYLPVTE